MRGLQLAQLTYGKNPKEPAARGSSIPVVKAKPVQAVAKSEDLYVRADHWVGMRSGLTDCLCLCHHPDGEGYDCGDMPGRPYPNWCNASPRS